MRTPTSPSASLNLERLKRLPTMPVTWQLAFGRLPKWVVPDDGEAFRPLVAMCMDAKGGLLGGGNSCAPGDPLVPEALAALDKLALTKGVGHRPQRVQVRDAALVGELAPVLEPLGISVEVVDELPALDAALADMQRHFASRSPVIAYPTSIPDDRLRAFADAADGFYRAALWNELAEEELIVVETPKAPAGMACFDVLGADGQQFGLGFYDSPEVHAELVADEFQSERGALDDGWLLSYEHAFELPIPDSERFEQLGLPLASSAAYPMLMGMTPRGGALVADPARLAFAEGLLRALAVVTPDQLDSGQWTCSVDTFDGPATYSFSLPALLAGIQSPAPVRRSHDSTMRDIQRLVSEQKFESPEELNEFLQTQLGKVPEHKSSGSPEDRALELLDRAHEAEGRLRIRLAREAVAIWPDCADAWVLQAEDMPDAARRMSLWRAAVAAGERAVGQQTFTDDVGHFWGVLKTRPYMRARMGLAQELWDAEEFDESMAHMLDMLRLDEGDHMELRRELAPRLMERGRDAEAARLLDAFAMDESAELLYARALLEFRAAGAGDVANARLAVAVRANLHAAKFLTGRTKPTAMPDERYEEGSEDQAAYMLFAQRGAWQATPGAIPWLGANLRPPRSERRAERKKKAMRRGR